ncbi:histidine kinase [Ancylobacter sp. VKM B-3255]|uniref:Histidine kinase n=1 Tax=Ancylobacter radicis TaxID=2836179 RepID=A0ABS5R9Y7_9HYPH|nr:histidine kinase [Ancylobacter radicis]
MRPFGPLGKPWCRLTPFTRAQIIGWGLFTLVDLVNRQLTYQDLTAALAMSALIYLLLAGLSTGLGRLYDCAFPGTVLGPWSVAVMALLASGASAVIVLVTVLVRQAFGWSIPDWGTLEEIALPFTHYAVALTGWSLLFFWIRADRQRQTAHAAALAAEAEALAAKAEALGAEIQQLRLQINPHFLFNALNGIAEEVPEHPAAARAMLRDLTDYLRHVLTGIRTPVVPVEAEVAALAAYLRIQQARFGERLRISVELDPGATGRRIANSLLQPLAENAVEHGDRSDVLELAVAVRLEGDKLRIDITNSGRLEPAHRLRAGHGLGLANLRRRLDVHYPGRHSFSLREIESVPGGAQVMATLLLEGEACSAS